MPRSRSSSRSSSRSREYTRKSSRKSKSHSRDRSHERDNDRNRKNRSRSRSASREKSGRTKRCLGIFNLNVYTSEQKIRDLFSKYGNVESVKMIPDAKTGRSRGYGFVYFKNGEDAKHAMEQCAGMEIDNKRVRVEYSLSQTPHPPTPGFYMGRRRRFRDNDRPFRRHDNFDRDRNGRNYRRSRSPSPYNRDRRRRNNRSRSRSYSPRDRKLSLLLFNT